MSGRVSSRVRLFVSNRGSTFRRVGSGRVQEKWPVANSVVVWNFEWHRSCPCGEVLCLILTWRETTNWCRKRYVYNAGCMSSSTPVDAGCRDPTYTLPHRNSIIHLHPLRIIEEWTYLLTYLLTLPQRNSIIQWRSEGPAGPTTAEGGWRGPPCRGPPGRNNRRYPLARGPKIVATPLQ